MESNCWLILDMPEENLRDKTLEFLTEDCRPTFEDEVEAEFRDLFTAFEFSNYADDLKKLEDKSLCAYFFMGGDFEEDMDDLFECFHKSGATNVFAYVEADEFNGLFYMDKKGYSRQISDKYIKYMSMSDVQMDEVEADSFTDNDMTDICQKLIRVKHQVFSAK